MREVGMVLMHREWRALFRRLDKHFRVMQLHVWAADDLRCGGREALVHQKPGEGG